MPCLIKETSYIRKLEGNKLKQFGNLAFSIESEMNDMDYEAMIDVMMAEDGVEDPED